MRMPARLLLLVLLPVASCTTSPALESHVLVVAHRGASYSAPENTIASFNLAWEEQADLIEGDFHLTADGHVVAHHDKTTVETAGVDRPVAGQTLAELQSLDVGRWKDERWAGERVPTLQEVLATVPAGRGMLIEIKAGPEIVDPLAAVVRSCGLQRDQMTVIAFDSDVIVEIKRALPWMRAFWLAEFEEEAPGVWRPTAEQIVRTAQQIGADGVDVQAETRVLDEAFMRALRDAGLEVHVWTVNEEPLARRMVELGVDSITTDRPGWLRAELEIPAHPPSLPHAD